jgi:WD40 repeat protein
MQLTRMLEGHEGCVNTVAFDPTGRLLVSGSDDQAIMLWNWEAGGSLRCAFRGRSFPRGCPGQWGAVATFFLRSIPTCLGLAAALLPALLTPDHPSASH